MKKETLKEALDLNDWNLRQTGQQLGVSHTWVAQLIARHDLQRPEAVLRPSKSMLSVRLPNALINQLKNEAVNERLSTNAYVEKILSER
jgi:predicted HicB family RNase H-like nuclease